MKIVDVYLPVGVNLEKVSEIFRILQEPGFLVVVVRESKLSSRRSFHEVYIQVDQVSDYCDLDTLSHAVDIHTELWDSYESKILTATVEVVHLPERDEQIYRFGIVYNNPDLELIASEQFVTTVLCAQKLCDERIEEAATSH